MWLHHNIFDSYSIDMVRLVSEKETDAYFVLTTLISHSSYSQSRQSI